MWIALSVVGVVVIGFGYTLCLTARNADRMLRRVNDGELHL